ncbi:MAG: hypothetical protein WCJ84_00635 [Candidatus Peregrinibacteria bacterium]
MTDTTTGQELDEEKEKKDGVEKPKGLPVVKPFVPQQKYSFGGSSSFKGAPGKTINNRQRPGRAAGRGR